MTVLMGGSPLPELIGILVGHIYFFLDEIYPNTGGPRLIKTPQILYVEFYIPSNTSNTLSIS
jgi:Derlin-2/3